MYDPVFEREKIRLQFAGGTIALGICIAACGWVLQSFLALKEAWTLWESLVVAFLASKLWLHAGTVVHASDAPEGALRCLEKIEERLADIEKRLASIDRKT